MLDLLVEPLSDREGLRRADERPAGATYGPRGVQVVAINSNDPHLYPDESYRLGWSNAAAEDGYTFPYLVDDGQARSRRRTARPAPSTSSCSTVPAGSATRAASTTPDSPDRVTTHDLANALDDVLAGREVRVPETRPFGCSLDLL